MNTHTGHTNAIAASRVIGTDVFNNEGERIGVIEDVMLEKNANGIMFAVIGFGGFLGIGDDYYPLPWQSLNYDTGLGGYVTDVSKERLRGAPHYARPEDADWADPAYGRRVFDYYGVGLGGPI